MFSTFTTARGEDLGARVSWESRKAILPLEAVTYDNVPYGHPVNLCSRSLCGYTLWLFLRFEKN